jgi:hypothetical protein
LPLRRRNELEANKQQVKIIIKVKIPDLGAIEVRASLGVDERFAGAGATRGSAEADEKRAAAV